MKPSVNYQLSMVSIYVELLTMIPKKAFGGLSVMTVADLLQLLPVREKLIFSQFCDKDSMKQLLGLLL